MDKQKIYLIPHFHYDKDRDLRGKLGKRALNFIEEGYTWKDAAEKTQRLLLHKKAGT